MTNELVIWAHIWLIKIKCYCDSCQSFRIFTAFRFTSTFPLNFGSPQEFFNIYSTLLHIISHKYNVIELHYIEWYSSFPRFTLVNPINSRIFGVKIYISHRRRSSNTFTSWTLDVLRCIKLKRQSAGRTRNWISSCIVRTNVPYPNRLDWCQTVTYEELG